MHTKLLFWLFVTLGIFLEIVGDVLFKKWSIDKKDFLFWLGLGVYMMGAIFWALSLKYETLSKAIAVFTVLNLIVVVAVGLVFFKEHISAIGVVGIFLGIISILLIELG